MKLFYLVALSLLTAPCGLAQQSATAQTQSNRMQELYDRYHGINRRAATQQPGATTASIRPVERRQASAGISRPLTMPAAPVSQRLYPAVQLGFRGGLVFPAFLESSQTVQPGTGFLGGVVLQLGQEWVSFQPELTYTREVVRVNVLGGGSLRSASNQLVVPLLVKLASGRSTQSRLFVNIGPYVSYLTSSSLNGLNIVVDRQQSRLGYGVAAGLGGSLRVNPGFITLEVRERFPLGNNSMGINRPRSLYTETAIAFVFPLSGR